MKSAAKHPNVLCVIQSQLNSQGPQSPVIPPARINLREPGASMQAEHHPFTMSWTDGKFTRAHTRIHTLQAFQIHFFLFTGSTKLILEIAPQNVNFTCFSYIDSQAGLN